MKHKLFAISAIQELLAPLPAKAPTDGETGGSLAKPGRMVFYGGSPVYRFDWMSGQEYMLLFDLTPKSVDLSRMAGAPVLADHWRSTDRIVGVIERAWIENGKAMAEYTLSETPDTENVRAKIEQKIIRQVSMEAVVSETEDVTLKGAKMRSFMATKWQPQAVALVPVGADPAAQLLEDDDGMRAAWLAEDLYVPPAQPKLDNAAIQFLIYQRRAVLGL